MSRKLFFPACLILALGIANVVSAATDPYPPDGAIQSQTWVFLTWTPGAGAVSYDVYFGEDLDEVENAARSGSTFQGNQIQMFFLAGFPGFAYPEGLVNGTTYYWRIDEIWADGTIYKGTVWNFKVTPDEGWIPFIPGAESEAVHDVKLKASDNTGIAVDSDIPGMHIVNVPVGGDVYQKLNIPYAGHTIEIGKPEVPVIRRYLEIPYDVNYLTVEILYSDPAIIGGYNVHPVQEPLVSLKTYEEPKFVIDHVTYSTDSFYPADIAVTDEPIIMRGHRITSLALFPVQFNPVEKQLKVYSKIEVRINYDRPAQIEGIEERLDSKAFESLCKSFILNYKPPDRYSTRRYKKIGSPSVDYLIISHDDFDTQVEPLADWKEKKGLRTEIVITNTICTNPAIDDVDEITDYLQNAYDTWNPPPTYVLLVGDVEFIPTHYQTAHGFAGHGGNMIASDLYYGTVDGADHFPDVFVGRISVDTAAQTTTVVNKILDYEKNPPTDAGFYTNISLCAYFQDNDPDGAGPLTPDNREDTHAYITTSMEIFDFLNTTYTIERIYSTNAANPAQYNDGTNLPNDLLMANGFLWDGDAADITNAINTGRFIVNHNDHGLSRNYWDERPAVLGGQWQGNFGGWDEPSFTTANIPGLTNDIAPNLNEFPIVFSINCMTGWFDGETDPYAWNFECFCEEFLRHQNGGAVAAIGASRISWTDWERDLNKGLFDALWPGFDPAMTTGVIYELGQILTYGKVYMANIHGMSTYEQTQFEQFHLFGDPEMWIWTQQPTALTVTHPATIGSDGSQQFAVTVRDNANNPVNHAAVGLFKDNDIHTAGYTNPSGYIIFDITPSTAGNMDITVTDHNHFPFEGTISVTDNGATITVSPDYGPPNISLTIAGSNFSVGETVNIDFGGTLLIPSPSTGTNDSFSQSFNVPTVPEGPINVIATGQTSGRVAVAAFRMMPAQPLPDPFTYSQWDSSTWYLDPSGGKVWNSPCIELREQNTGNTVSSNNLRVGTTYTIRATIYNATAVAANGTNVTFKYAEWAAGQKVWNIIDTDTVNLFPAMLVPSSAVASALWTPITTGHCCIVVEIDHPWDTNLKNNKGQENTDVHPITSPAEITFDVFNPTDARALVYLEVTQNDPCEPGELWGTRIQREYPQILEPGERQTATLEVLAPDNVETGESRTITVTGTIEGETIGGVEIQVIKDNPPVLTDGYVDPNSGIAGADFTYWVTYTDEDNHSPMNGYPALSIFKAGEPIAGSPFAMEAEDPNDSDYSDGKTYVCSISLSESGKDYTHSFWARDSLGIGAEGPAITMVPGPLVEPILGDLVAHYAFENDTTDSSGNGLDGTVIGDPEFVDGAEGMALDFNGDHYVDCGGNAEFSFTDAMTVSTWVNIRSVTTAWMAMIAKGENAWRLGVNNQTTGIHYAFTGSARDWQAANTATELPFDEWYHVAATYDTNVGALVYINGVLDASNPDIGGIVTNEMPLLLGDNPEATGRFFDGMLDEVKIYNRALSAEEIGYLAGLR